MDNSQINALRDQLSGKINVYLKEDSYEMLQQDAENFEVFKDEKKRIVNLGELLNRLVKNYITVYYRTVDQSAQEISQILQESFAAENPEMLRRLSREIAFRRNPSQEKKGRHSRTLPVRLWKENVAAAVSALCAAPDTMDLSAFFRNMILSYQSLPVYRREQIIYKEEIEAVERAIQNHEVISYRKKDIDSGRKMLPVTIERSKQELFNYVIGQSATKYHSIISVRIARMRDIFSLPEEKEEKKPSFDKCLQAMKENGVQFGMDQLILHKAVMSEQDESIYQHRYFERPVLYDSYTDTKNRKIYVFLAKDFQIESYFTPFRKEEILLKKIFFAEHTEEHLSLTEVLTQSREKREDLRYLFDHHKYRIHFKKHKIVFNGEHMEPVTVQSIEELLQIEQGRFTVEEMLLSLTEEDLLKEQPSGKNG